MCQFLMSDQYLMNEFGQIAEVDDPKSPLLKSLNSQCLLPGVSPLNC
jgi:hypothetical protein